MVLTRALRVGLIGLAAAGCKQSLFDAHVGADAGTGPADARAGASDGGGTGDDAAPGPDSGPPGDASPAPDATPDADAGPVCPATCRGNAAADFAGSQGGTTGRWRYLEVASDGSLAELIYGAWTGLAAWVPSGATGPPAVLACALHPGAEACAGVDDRVLMVPRGGDPAFDPVLEFAPPARGAYRMRGDHRFADGAATGPNLVLTAYRNVPEDTLLTSLLVPDTAVTSFVADLEVVAGDRVYLRVQPETAGAPAPLGVNQYFSEDVGSFPGGCGLTTRFETVAGPAIGDDCTLVSYTARRTPDNGSTYVDLEPALVSGPRPVLGQAVQLGEGDYLLPAGAAMDYSGSFTVQMWLQMVPSWTTMAVYADWDNGPPIDGGINLSMSSAGRFYATGLYGDDMFVEISFDYPDDGGAWHFVRLVRNAAANTFRICVDGQLRAGATLAGGLDLSPQQPPYLGRNVVYNPPYFIGAIDDVRVFDRALPCPN